MAHGILDEAYERLLRTGPELVGGLTNHGPMVVECLVHLGRADRVHRGVRPRPRRSQLSTPRASGKSGRRPRGAAITLGGRSSGASRVVRAAGRG